MRANGAIGSTGAFGSASTYLRDRSTTRRRWLSRGWYATILDSALGCAVHTMLPAGRGYTTSQLNLQLVRSIPLSVERVQAVGEVVHCGRQLATAQSQLLGPDGSLYAHATCTCLIFDLPESTSR